MSEKETNANDWNSCPSGEMGRLVAVLRGKRRTRQTMAIGGTVGAVVVLIALGNIGIGLLQDPVIAGVTCRHVGSVAADYIDGKLDAAEAEHVRQHLEKCRHCREAIAKLRKEKAKHDVAAQASPLLDADAPQTVAAL